MPVTVAGQEAPSEHGVVTACGTRGDVEPCIRAASVTFKVGGDVFVPWDLAGEVPYTQFPLRFVHVSLFPQMLARPGWGQRGRFIP